LQCVCAAITEHQKIDKAQKRHDVYRLLFTLQLRDAEFNDSDAAQRNNLTRRLQIVIYTQTTRFNI